MGKQKGHPAPSPAPKGIAPQAPVGVVKQSERGSPTTQPAAVVGNPQAGREKAHEADPQQAKSDAAKAGKDKGATE